MAEATPKDLPRGWTRTSGTRSSKTRSNARGDKRTRQARRRSLSPRHMADGVYRRADPCDPVTDYVRHRATELARVGENRKP
jgi:hypothetical protein